MLIFFFFYFFTTTIIIFKIKPPFLFVYQFNNQEKNSITHLFYVYIVARSRIQQEHYLMILCSTIQEDARTLIFFLINVAETNQEKIKKQKTQIEGYNL
jgi:hypothetical protein